MSIGNFLWDDLPVAVVVLAAFVVLALRFGVGWLVVGIGSTLYGDRLHCAW